MNTVEIIQTDQPATAILPMDLMQRAVTSGADVAVLEKLMGLQERWEANQARKSFDAALSAAKAEIPVIQKSQEVDFTTSKGRTHYRYENLADIAGAIDPILGKYGLSYRFRTATIAPNAIAVTCIISHRDGHYEETTLPGSHDVSGNKNDNQAVGSAVTYLQRYTLKAALGLAAAYDDDAQSTGGETSDAYVQRWYGLLARATDEIELGVQWRAEHDLRRSVFRTDGERDAVKRLAAAVTKRGQDLKAEFDQTPKEQDLQTQRLEAQDQ